MLVGFGRTLCKQGIARDVFTTRGALEGYVLSQRFSAYRQLTAVARGTPEKTQAATLINKLYSSELGKRLAVGEVNLTSGPDESLVAHVTSTYSIPPDHLPVEEFAD